MWSTKVDAFLQKLTLVGRETISCDHALGEVSAAHDVRLMLSISPAVPAVCLHLEFTIRGAAMQPSWTPIEHRLAPLQL